MKKTNIMDRIFEIIDWISNKPTTYGWLGGMSEEEACELADSKEHALVRYRLAMGWWFVEVYPRCIPKRYREEES